MCVEYDCQATWKNLYKEDLGIATIQDRFSTGNTDVVFEFDDTLLTDEVIPTSITLRQYVTDHFDHVTVAGGTEICKLYLVSVFDIAEIDPYVWGLTIGGANGIGPNAGSFILFGYMYNELTFTVNSENDTLEFCTGDYDDIIPMSYWVANHELGHQRAGLQEDNSAASDCIMKSTIPTYIVSGHTKLKRFSSHRVFCTNCCTNISNQNW